jgi:superfamily II DNA or RNA helicase
MCKTRCGSVKFWALQNIFLVPRIVLVEQNVKRLLNYGLLKDSVGVYYGERKDVKEITMSTYQSVIDNFDLIRNGTMIVLYEIHLLSDTVAEFDRIFDIILEDPKKAILGLTTALNEKEANIQPSKLLRHPLENI